MKAIARMLMLGLAGACSLTAGLPAQADHRHHRDWGHPWDRHPHPHHYAPPAWAHRPPVVVHRPPVVIYDAPVVYERRVYYGPTCYTGDQRHTSLRFTFTLPLR